MPQDTRSLWEQYDSEVEPWRRGRMVLGSIGTFYFLLQAAVFTSAVMQGNIEAVVLFGSVCAVFWLLFYFIWIGVQWIRWLAGAWCGLSGFVFLIWALTDSNGLFATIGSINLIIATCLCLSSSVYFFAKHQQERRNWLHSLAVGSVFVLLFLTFIAGSVGLFIYHAQLYADAVRFADEAAEHIYTDQEPDWMFAHFSPEEMASVSPEGRRAFFRDNVGRIGPVLQISTPTGSVWFSYHFPTQFKAWAKLRAQGKSSFGPVLLYFDISDPGDGWRIDKTWSERAYTEKPPDYR
ncbi:MAG TPA: hypothetical protein VJ721_08750 [Chthoniobacterales bacterium]|nr:hypothetical protein [Chthoniobacterales bacterium]